MSVVFAVCVCVCVSAEGVIDNKGNSQNQLFKILVGRFQIPHSAQREDEGGTADVYI